MTPRLSLPAEPASVSRARRFVREAVQSLGAPAAVEDAELLVSELATNAVLHARSAFTVEVRRHLDRVRICILDASPVPPKLRSYGEDATTGRGLQLVQRLSAAWGVEQHRPGKAVWVELLVDGSDPHPSAQDLAGADVDDFDALLSSFGDDGDQGPVARVPPAGPARAHRAGAAGRRRPPAGTAASRRRCWPASGRCRGRAASGQLPEERPLTQEGTPGATRTPRDTMPVRRTARP